MSENLHEFKKKARDTNEVPITTRTVNMIIPYHWGLKNLQNVLDSRLGAFKGLAPWLANIKVVFSRSGPNVLSVLKRNSLRVGGMERR